MSFYSIFPDVNVLLALTVESHPHHRSAVTWWSETDVAEVVLCRATQLGFLRLLTLSAAMGAETLTNREAWNHYGSFCEAVSTRIASDPAGLEDVFRSRSAAGTPSPKLWMDMYLSAFANQAHLLLVTFDAALSKSTPKSILLRG